MSLKLGLRNKIRRSRAAGGFVGLLDQPFAQGATAAYSLRLLRSKYSGAAVRVREDSGNTEADIGFSGGTLDTTALLNHVGSNNGFVTKWYDQSGNGNDASNSTATEQPKIVSGGTVVQENGRPALNFNLKFLVSSYPLNERAHSYMYFTLQSVKSKQAPGAILQGGRSFVIERGSTVNGNIGGAELSMPFNLNNQFIFTGEWNLLNNNYRIFKNDVQKKSITTPPDRTTLQTGIGASNGGVNCNAFIQEILIFEGNDFSGRSDINKNIINHYSI